MASGSSCEYRHSTNALLASQRFLLNATGSPPAQEPTTSCREFAVNSSNRESSLCPFGISDPVDSKAAIAFKKSSHASALKRRRPATGDAVADVLMLSLSTLAAAWLEAEAKAEELESHIERIVREKAPAMLEIDGCGALSAVELGLAAGDNPERMRSEASFAMLCGASPIEASSGKTVRHRLNRGGNRQANRALHSIVVSRMRSDERTSEYIARRVSEGKSKREAMRCLKRYVAREVYRALMSPTTTRHAAGAELRPGGSAPACCSAISPTGWGSGQKS